MYTNANPSLAALVALAAHRTENPVQACCHNLQGRVNTDASLLSESLVGARHEV